MQLLADMSLVVTLLNWLLIAVCVLLILVVLVQKGRGSGLAGAFGGGGGSSSAFGAKTGDVFTWITVGLAAVFVLVTVAANFAYDRSSVQVTLPGATPAPATGEAATDEGEGDAAPAEATLLKETEDGKLVPAESAAGGDQPAGGANTAETSEAGGETPEPSSPSDDPAEPGTGSGG